MATYNKVFQRLEKKYMLSSEQYELLMSRIKNMTESDEFGQYTISNIYLDTEDYSLIRSSIEKPIYKEKLRIRKYDSDNASDKVFLELKKKFDGTVYKRRVAMSDSQAYAYITGGLITGEKSQIFREIDWVMKRYQPKPSVYLAYERQALKALDNSGLRITFDTNMRFRTQEYSFSGGSWGHPLLEDNSVLMEIKALGALPLWLAEILSDLEIFPTSFSKYGTCYKNYLAKSFIERSVTCA
ncbi:MAG: polyphosphate polymerase domain-containing protein [Sporomusa sp.]